MKYIKNEEKLEDFRRRLREWKIDDDWKKFNYGRPKWLKNDLGVQYETFKKVRDREIYEKQISGDELENEVAEYLLDCFSDRDYVLIHDFIFDNDSVQIDLLLITHVGIFIIEVKDWEGTYIVKNSVWNKIGTDGEVYIKDEGENPTYQVKRHKNALNTLLERGNLHIPLYPLIYINNEAITKDTRTIFNDLAELGEEIDWFIKNNERGIDFFFDIKEVVKFLNS